MFLLSGPTSSHGCCPAQHIQADSKVSHYHSCSRLAWQYSLPQWTRLAHSVLSALATCTVLPYVSFTAGVALLNGVDGKYLSPILQRVLKSLKDRSNSLFSDAEEEQLCSVLALPPPALHSLLSLLQYVYETALYHSLSAVRLGAVLPDSIEASHAELLVAAYGGVRDEMLSALLADVGDGPAVGDIGWRMHVRLADTTAAAERGGKEVKTIWRIGIKDRQLSGGATTEDSIAGDGDSVVFELGKAELEALYDNLETMQKQLDALTEKKT